MVFVLDNYDSFTYNLVQALGQMGADVVVERNDALAADDVLAQRPVAIVISPGPGLPRDAGIAVPLVRAAAQQRIPLLGVCLGHQAIGEAFGAKVVRARRLMHGKASDVKHEGEGVLAGLPSPFSAMRYHSLVLDPDSLPAALEPTAWAADGAGGWELMAMQHQTLPIHGLQFHPESIGTPVGETILRTFLTSAVRR